MTDPTIPAMSPSAQERAVARVYGEPLCGILDPYQLEAVAVIAEIAATDFRDGVLAERIWEFNEERLPIFVQGPAGANELSEPVTVERLNQLVQAIEDAAEDAAKAERARLLAALPNAKAQIRSAIGGISISNRGIIGYPEPLSSQLGSQLLDQIVEVALRAADDFLEKANG